jgi:hypothetical protein
MADTILPNHSQNASPEGARRSGTKKGRES